MCSASQCEALVVSSRATEPSSAARLTARAGARRLLHFCANAAVMGIDGARHGVRVDLEVRADRGGILCSNDWRIGAVMFTGTRQVVEGPFCIEGGAL